MSQCIHNPFLPGNTLVIESHWGAGTRLRCTNCGGCSSIDKVGTLLPETCSCHSPPEPTSEDERLTQLLIDLGIWNPATRMADLTIAARLIDQLQRK